MDDSKKFQLMLDKAVESEPIAFENFDRTKNVQDQLQNMCDNAWWGQICDMSNWISSSQFAELYGAGDMFNPTILNSFEQLWLAFVMKEKFNKVWDDKKEEWIS